MSRGRRLLAVALGAVAAGGAVAALLSRPKAPSQADCVTGWPHFSASIRAACARADAQRAVYGLNNILQQGDEESGIRATTALCSELSSCAENCARELSLLTLVAWSAWPIAKPDLARMASPDVSSCPEFLPVAASDSPAQARERAKAWARARVAEFSRRACRDLDGSEQARLSCAFVKLGLGPLPGACGKAEPACGAAAGAN